MRRCLSAPLAVLALCAATLPGQAQDWSGFYAGGLLEGVAGQVTGPGADTDVSGAFGGAFAGYRFDTGTAVYGIEIDAAFGAAEADIAPADEVTSVLRAGLEAGLEMGPVLAYATGGAAYVTWDINTLVAPDIQEQAFGVFYGVGLDMPVSDRVILGAELLQHQFTDSPAGDFTTRLTTFGVNLAFQF